MNDIQKKSFEMLQIFVRICEKWEIPYYLVCGSVLGAAKYGGFIPWDDDIDVGLLRRDYQRFLEVAPKELPEWCFLQNYRTEKVFPHTFSKLRNTQTIFLEEGMAKLPINHGIYLDIFPIDGYPKGFWEQKRLRCIKKWYDWIRFSVVEYPKGSKESLRNSVIRFFGGHKRVSQAQRNLEKFYCRFTTDGTEIWCNYGNWQGELEYAPKWHYGKGTWLTFEGLRVRVPENYDAYLTQKYGDWRLDPPPEQQKSHHNAILIDAEHSYRDYIRAK